VTIRDPLKPIVIPISVLAGIEVHQTLAAKSGLCVLGFGARASVGRVAAKPVEVPPLDPLREAGTRTNNALLAPAHSPPRSVATQPRVAARSPMNGASLRRRTRPRADAKRSSRPSDLKVQLYRAHVPPRHASRRRAVRHRRTCASLVASFAAGVAAPSPMNG